MTDQLCDRLVSAVDRLPDRDVVSLAAALDESSGLWRFRSRATSPIVRSACGVVADAVAETSASLVAGVLLGAVSMRRARPSSVDVVWTGPSSGVRTSRLTAAAVVELVDQATAEILLMSFVMYPEPALEAALQRAGQRGATITLVHDHPDDNPSFHGPSVAFARIRAHRLRWPAARRPHAASLHAKVLVVDRTVALVGSANITSSAMVSNVECGLLVRDSAVASGIAEHVDDLLRRGDLVRDQ